MIRTISYGIDVLLVVFLAREVWQFRRRYRRLEEEVAAGDRDARSRLYRRVLRFQWLAAGFAVAAVRFDWSAFHPQSLGLSSSPLFHSLAGALGDGALGGLATGVGVGTAVLVLMRLRQRRAGAAQPGAGAPALVRRLLPDFSALLPVTVGERWQWFAISISAGVCEEIVFRGWLLSVLHTPLGLAGTGLIVVAAACFGIAHAYQGPAGVVLTGIAGVVFCVLYAATGGLLVPMVLHAVVDARFALLPRGDAGRVESAPVPGGLRAV